MSSTSPEWTLLSMIEWATNYFITKGVKSPRLSIEWLISYVLDIKRLDIYLAYDRPLTEDELGKLRPLVKRRAQHEPLQYITGQTDFYNAVIKVDTSVLIPRQETEQLVELILSSFPKDTALKTIDLGTGSGCIPIALAMERPEWIVSAIDISTEALQLAQENALLNNAQVDFYAHSFFDSLPDEKSGTYDLIISNPPYILDEEKESLDVEVKDFEPHLALFCESTQNMYEAMEQFCSRYLTDKGTAYFEIHENYGAECMRIFSEKSWQVRLEKDYDSKDRFLIVSH